MNNQHINLALVVEYDGRNFFGFQKQPNFRTIQGELEQAITKFTSNNNHNINMAGRTDALVHATYQIINFNTYCTNYLN
jgi:tRNA pseudouridine38-40 synthase